MLKLLQYQSTVSHPTQMQVDGGDNYNYFGNKHLVYVLFVKPTSVYVTGGSIFSDSIAGLVPVMFPGPPTLHSLDKAYWNPIYLTKNLSLSALKLYSGFCRDSHESLSSCTFFNSQGHTFPVKK